MGSDRHYPEEAPAHRVRVDAFAHRPLRGHERGSSPRSSTPPATSPSPNVRSTLPTSRARPPENLVPGSLVFTPTPGPVDLRHLSQWWTWTPGRLLARARGARLHDRRPPRPPGRARRPRGRRRVRGWVGAPAADRGRVGVRRPRRARRRRVHVGRRGPPRRAAHGQHVGRARLPVALHRRVRLPAHRPGRLVPGQRLRPATTWPATSGSGPTTGGPAAIRPTPTSRAACRTNPRGGDLRSQLRPGAAAVPHPAQGDQGRVAPLRRHATACATGRPPAARR